ncbi:MAG: hypothetical protein IT424_03625 [Pirellulales bacterium]|nr:hypothetical protein [Pirellulales bacterium]
MQRVGISFRSSLSPEEVYSRYILPLRTALEAARAGIYSNYLRQLDEREGAEPAEHLLIFEVFDFEHGLRLLRVKLQEIGMPAGAALHNLEASDPLY